MSERPFNGTERFELVRHVGSGGMGAVYEVRDRERDARAALKVLHHVDPSAIYRFKKEFRALADVAHPNLVTLYELLSAGDQWFLTMEYVEGIDMLSYVRGTGERSYADTAELATAPRRARPSASPIAKPLSGGDELERLRDTLRQLASGLSALHEAGRVHRDVKPSNVIVTMQGRVVVLDFGLVGELARATPDPDERDQIMGTAAYIAPEQVTSSEVTPAADWYSVGVILYQALTGRVPFQGDTFDVLASKETTDALAPSTLVDDVPEDLDRLCSALLERDPAARPSGAEILAALGADPRDRGAGPATDLVGRERHLQALDAALERARGGKCVSMFVRGPSGMGKTALARRFVDSVRARGDIIVLEGRCYERESVPYKAFDSLVDELGRVLLGLPAAEVEAILPHHAQALGRVFPVLRRIEGVTEAGEEEEVPDPVELQRRAIAALRELMVRLSDRYPVVLAIDDLQWGDADSVLVLSELTRPPDAPALLLIACVRTDGSGDRMAASLRDKLVGAAGGEVRELAVLSSRKGSRSRWHTMSTCS